MKRDEKITYAAIGLVSLGFVAIVIYKLAQQAKAATPNIPAPIITEAEVLKFHSMGDANDDGKIDSVDLGLLNAAFGMDSSNPGWFTVQKYDLNGDGKIDGKDLGTCARNQGLNIFTYFGK